MVTEETKRRIAQAYIDQSLNGREVLTCRQILQENLPPYIKDAVLGLARKRLLEEKPITWNFKANLDLDHPDVKEAFENFVYILIKSVRFQRKEIETLFFRCIGQRVDLLIRPIDALKRLLFSETAQQPSDSLAKTLRKISYRNLFVDRLADSIDQLGEKLLDWQTFRSVCLEVQKEQYADAEKAIVREWEKLEQIFQMDPLLANRGIEGSLVEEFLTQRHLPEIVDKARKETVQGRVYWKIQDIKDLFSFSSMTQPKTEKSGLPRIIFSDESQRKIKVQKIQKQPPGPYPSLFSLLEKTDYRDVVRKIFQKDQDAFIHFIDTVDNIDQWGEAKRMIDGELEKRQLDPYCKEALKLGDIVFSKYFSKGRFN